MHAVARRGINLGGAFNNHNVGKGPVNALEIAALLNGTSVPAPPTLLAHYAELRDVLDELPGAVVREVV